MYKRFIVLLGIFLGSDVPAVAQTPAPKIVLAQISVAPTMHTVTMLRTISTPLPAASLLLYQDPRKFPTHFSPIFAGTYVDDRSLEHLPPMEEVKTLFFKQSSLPLAQLWGGRLQLDAFQSTLRIESVQSVPLGYGDTQGVRPLRQSYPGGPRSVHLSGFSLNFYFGRNARTRHTTQAWRCLPKIVGTVLN
jgi:hypothetical protein